MDKLNSLQISFKSTPISFALCLISGLVLEDLGYDVKSAEIDMVPKVTQKCNEKESDLVLKLLDALEDNDDVNKLYTNFELS